MGKAFHQILMDDSVWGGIKLAARAKGFSRTPDYLEPIMVEIVRLERSKIDPLAILQKAGKSKE